MVIHETSSPDPGGPLLRVPFKETIFQKVTNVHGKFSGLRDLLGHIVIDVQPTEPNKGILFINKVSDKTIPKNILKSIEGGFRDQTFHGILAGYPVTDILIALVGGTYPEVNSNENAFRLAAQDALFEALHKGKSILLEPIIKCQILTSDKYYGAIVGDLLTRRAKIISLNSEEDRKVLQCCIPLMEMSGYARAIHSLSEGTAFFYLDSDEYSPVPWVIARKIIENNNKNDN